MNLKKFMTLVVHSSIEATVADEKGNIWYEGKLGNVNPELINKEVSHFEGFGDNDDIIITVKI